MAKSVLKNLPVNYIDTEADKNSFVVLPGDIRHLWAKRKANAI